MSKIAKPQTWKISTKLKFTCASLMFIGLVSFIVSAMTDPDRAWHAYMLGFFYTTSLAVGGLFFTSVQHAANAGWSVNIRRFCESYTAFLPHCFAAALIFVLGVTFSGANVYDWLNPEMVAKDHLLQHKVPYLKPNILYYPNDFIFWTLDFLCQKNCGLLTQAGQQRGPLFDKKKHPALGGFSTHLRSIVHLLFYRHSHES